MTHRTVNLLRATIANDSPFVTATRKYLGDLILACYRDHPDALPYAERLSTAAAELLENALKFSPPGTALSVQLSQTRKRLKLEVSNALKDGGVSVLGSIHREIEAVWSEKDAKEAFRKKVMASLADPKAKAMLGYAKIRMETGGRLKARLNSAGRLAVSLDFPLLPPELLVR